MEASNPLIPETPPLAAKALAQLVADEQRITNMIGEIGDGWREISAQRDAVFERIQHPPIKDR